MNRQFIKKTAYNLSKPFPLKWMRRLSDQHFIFPFYHVVTDHPSPCIKHLFPVTTEKQFKRDLDFLLRNFSPAGYPEVKNFLEKEKKADKPLFFLSFDDGFAECNEIIAPILKAKGIPAAFFINPDFVGNKQLSHRQKVSLIIDKILQPDNSILEKRAGKLTPSPISGKATLIQWVKSLTITDTELIHDMASIYDVDFVKALDTYQPYMSLAQIQQLKADGFIIGSHSLNHPEFNLLSEEEMKQQIEGSFQYLENQLHTEYRVFSFPFHDIGIPSSFFNFLVHEVNVEASFGTSGIKNDNAPNHIQRIPLELSGFHQSEEIIRSEYFYYLVKILFGKNRIRR